MRHPGRLRAGAALMLIQGAILVALVGAQLPVSAADAVPPLAPTDVRATAGADGVTVRWQAPPPQDDTMYVAYVGDSVFNTLMPDLVSATESAGWGAIDMAFGGCALTGAFQVFPDGKPFWWSQRCSEGFAAMQSRVMRDFQPEVVVWHSTRERQAFIKGGRVLQPGTPEFRKARDRDLARAYKRFAVRGAHIVIIPAVPMAPSVRGYCAAAPEAAICTRDDTYHASFDDLTAAFERLAAAHPRRITMMSIDDLLCPGGRDCPLVEHAGVAVRPDGVHFSPAGAAWLAPLIVERLRLAPVSSLARGIDDAPAYPVPITGYTVTAQPGGQTCSWTSGPLHCTVVGLAPGTAYTFTVTATNAIGTGPASVPSAPVTPLRPPKRR